MQIFNTMTRQKEEFTPQKEGEYRIYVCGPTVYNYIHIGNARPMIVFDTLRRYLEYCGNKVYYVSNITDIDDKLIKKGQEEGTSMQEVARKFEAEYIKDSDGLNVKTPTVRPRATEHIGEIIGIVKDLVESGHAYVARNGDVYFRVKSDPDYGKLSHLNLDDLESGNRALRSQMNDDLKEDPADFAVWKAAKPGEPYWESPWGHGRPGWHIECSAMARKHLGKTIDLHAGGQDLIFPHHENEIAQSECANGCTFSRYWMHNGFLNINNEKMSKSANNFFTVREIADKYGYEPIRYFMLTAGYRMPLNYTVELIESCKNSLERMYTCRDNLDFAIEHAHGTDTALVEKCAEARKKFKAAMDDDLNTPDALAAIFDLVKDINTLSDVSDKATLEEAAKTMDELTGVLGLLYNRKKTDSIPAEVTALVEERAAAKKAKDWGRADAIRAQLTEMGWSVTDTAQGPKIAKLSAKTDAGAACASAPQGADAWAGPCFCTRNLLRYDETTRKTKQNSLVAAGLRAGAAAGAGPCDRRLPLRHELLCGLGRQAGRRGPRRLLQRGLLCRLPARLPVGAGAGGDHPRRAAHCLRVQMDLLSAGACAVALRLRGGGAGLYHSPARQGRGAHGAGAGGVHSV